MLDGYFLMPALLPLFLTLTGRRVLLVGAGPVAAAKLTQLLAAGALVRVVAPDVDAQIERAGVTPAAGAMTGGERLEIVRRAFEPADLDDVWLVVAAATPAVNREVGLAAGARRLFVNAVDDPANATAFLSGVVRRNVVTIAISTSGHAPALTALLREALDAVLPDDDDFDAWIEEAQRQRAVWRRDGVPMDRRRPLLLNALNRLYDPPAVPRPEQADTPFDHVDRAAVPASAAGTFRLEDL